MAVKTAHANHQRIGIPGEHVCWGSVMAFRFGSNDSYPQMTGGWAVVGLAVVGLIGHSVRFLVRFLMKFFLIDKLGSSSERK